MHGMYLKADNGNMFCTWRISEDRDGRGENVAYISTRDGTLQVNAGYQILPEGSQTWKCWNKVSTIWEHIQVVSTVFRTETQAADAEMAEKAANEVEMSKKAAAATAQLAGVDQIVVSGLPTTFCSDDCAGHPNAANGTFRRREGLDDASFPVFQQPGEYNNRRCLLYSTAKLAWVITGRGGRGLTAIGQNSDGTLPVGSCTWSCFGANRPRAWEVWHMKAITVDIVAPLQQTY